MLEKLHEGHHGVVKGRLRAKPSVWLPGLSKQLKELVTNCIACARERHIHAEFMVPSESRLRPWQKVATDMFVYKGRTYLFVVDYYPSYVEIAKLENVASSDVIIHFNSIFVTHGISETVVSDNAHNMQRDHDRW